MIKTTTAAVIGLGMAAFTFAGAYAQDGAMKPADGKMAMSSKMSDKDMATMKMCKEMSHDAMMKDQKCVDMAKMHPDAMKSTSGAMMSSGGMAAKK